MHIVVPAGPAGLALNASGSRLFVYSRIANAITMVDTQKNAVLLTKTLFTPESSAVRDGRRFLYDATASSANGSVSCGSCHVFGDMDHLAWDLGNTDDATSNNPNAYVSISPKTTFRFHPLKGPMTTQTLRGMRGNGPLHWRGDRTGSNRASVRGATETLEEAAFKEFNPAFVSLLGVKRRCPPRKCRRSPTLPCSWPCRRTRCERSTTRSPRTKQRDARFTLKRRPRCSAPATTATACAYRRASSAPRV
jgi:hypothetical protein